jgi:G3E family GTPase
MMSYSIVILGAVLLVATLLLANFLAGLIRNARLKRIDEKFQQLIQRRQSNYGRIPVTLITGFLGAGKTSLLNRILARPNGRRICVIENEAGAVSIDHALLKGNVTAPDGLLVLENGCACCSTGGTGDELERTLDKVLQLAAADEASGEGGGSGGDAGGAGRSSASASASSSAASSVRRPRFDHVVIETSGLVDPAPLVQTFFRSSLASSRFALDAVVTVVDAKNITQHLPAIDAKQSFSSSFGARQHEAGQQIAYADIVLLNKIDSCDATQREAARGAIRSVNPAVEIIETTQCNVDIERLLDQHAFDVDRAHALLQEQLASQGVGVSSDSGSARVVARHREIQALTFTPGRISASSSTSSSSSSSSASSSSSLPVLSYSAVEGWLQAVIKRHWERVYRTKGLLRVRVRVSDEGGPGETRGRGKGKNNTQSQLDSNSAYRWLLVQGVHADLQASFLDPASLEDSNESSNNSSNHSATTAALVLIGKNLAGTPLEVELRESWARDVLQASGLEPEPTPRHAGRGQGQGQVQGHGHACGADCDHGHSHAHVEAHVSAVAPRSGPVAKKRRHSSTRAS